MTYKDLDENPAYADELRQLGSQGIPTFVKGDQVQIGFDPNIVRAMLD